MLGVVLLPNTLRYVTVFQIKRSRRLMDRTLASEAENKGSIPFESTKRVWLCHTLFGLSHSILPYTQ